MDYTKFIKDAVRLLNPIQVSIDGDSAVGYTSKSIQQVEKIIFNLTDKITYKGEPVYFEQVDDTRSKYDTEVFGDQKICYHYSASEQYSDAESAGIDIVYYLFNVDSSGTVFYIYLYKD